MSDIYGGDYSSVGLKGTTIASTCGKLQAAKHITGVSPLEDGALKWVKAPHYHRAKRSNSKTALLSSTSLTSSSVLGDFSVSSGRGRSDASSCR